MTETELDWKKINDSVSRAELINRLVEIRQEKKLRQVDIAAAMGIGQPSVSEFERGMVDPKLSTLQRYARAVGVELKLEVKESGDAE